MEIYLREEFDELQSNSSDITFLSLSYFGLMQFRRDDLDEVTRGFCFAGFITNWVLVICTIPVIVYLGFFEIR